MTLQPPPAPAPAGWEGILDQGEVILWQGVPDGGIAFAVTDLPKLLGGVLMVGFSMFWMFNASKGGGYFWMFGLIFLFIGAGTVTRDTLGAARRRRASHYTLTNRRAIIATNLPLIGRSLNSYPIDAGTLLELVEQDDLGTVNFARRETPLRRGTQAAQRIGFERIPEPRRVFSLMRQIQHEAK